MERMFPGIDITPTDVMRVRLDRGDIKLSEFMEWLVADRTWDSVKDSVMKSKINKAPLQ